MRREKLQFIYLKSTFCMGCLLLCSGLGKRSGMYKDRSASGGSVLLIFCTIVFFYFA